MPTQLAVERAYGLIRAAIAANVGWDRALEPEIREALSGLERAYMSQTPCPVNARLLSWIRDHEGVVASHREISEAIHVARETVTRRIHALCADGTIWRQAVCARGGKGLPRWRYGLERQEAA